MRTDGVYLSYSIRNIRLEWEAGRYMDCSLMAHGSGKSIWIRLWTRFSIIRWTKLQKVLSVCLTIIADLSTQTSSVETQRYEWLQVRSTNRLIILETCLIKHGFQIPTGIDVYSAFTEQMRCNEIKFLDGILTSVK